MLFKDHRKPALILHEFKPTEEGLKRLPSLNIEGIYITVHHTKDGELVAIGSNDLSELGLRTSVNELLLSDLRGEIEVLTLSEVISTISKSELKILIRLGDDSPKTGKEVINILRELNYASKSALVSREISIINKLVREEPRLSYGVYVSNPYPNIPSLRRLGITELIMPYSLIRSRIVKEAHGRGVEVIAWLINDPAAYVKMVSLGVDAVVTEKPEVAREAKGIT